jgi:putative PIN family toxin of toxin-antitoxin system
VIRAVIDTSVLVRYLIKPGVATRELIEVQWLDNKVQMVTAPELIAELEGVLRRDYIQQFVQADEAQALLDAIFVKAEVLPPLGQVPAFTRDPKDDKFVACALAGNAGYVITEDKDILALEALSGVRMVTPAQFMAVVS